ncbi:MAG: HD domain-containing protein [Planctomycetota bacterium]|jgi:(p)ppGpp synthase/HD superfamily hydrolase
MPDLPLWHEAAAIAATAHRNQIRKDGFTPYVAHPLRVAMIIAVEFGCQDETTLAAALLHDIIEDCDHDYDDVHEACGREVADLVAAMTKDMRLIETEREQAYEAQLAAAPWQARLLKLADTYDNLRDAGTPDRCRKAVEKARIALTLAGDDPRLATAAAKLVQLIAAVEASMGDAPRGGAGKDHPARVSDE